MESSANLCSKQGEKREGNSNSGKENKWGSVKAFR